MGHLPLNLRFDDCVWTGIVWNKKIINYHKIIGLDPIDS
jgi:hypothetical protein